MAELKTIENNKPNSSIPLTSQTEYQKEGETPIPEYIKPEDGKEDIVSSLEKSLNENELLLERLAQKDKLSAEEKLIYGKWNRFRYNTDETFRRLFKKPKTIMVFIRSDTSVYPIELEIDGKTVKFGKGRRFKLDGYESRIYDLNGRQTIFVDINDARLLSLSHKTTNPAYDSREFCTLFDTKIAKELLGDLTNENKLDRMWYLILAIAGLSLFTILILWGVIKPEWMKELHQLFMNAASTANTIINTPIVPSQPIPK